MDFEGSSQLPRVLFTGEVLAQDGCVVACAQAERDGDELTLEEVSDLGQLRQASVDEDGVREALLRHDHASPALIARRGARFEVSVAAGDRQRAGELAERLAGRIRVERDAADTRVSVAFWSGSGDGFPGTPEPRWRRLQLPRFATIEDNYRSQVKDRLAQLLSWRSGDGMPGRLALWHGPPGTGKTWALRALGREWNDWCDLHYVTDPERLLGGDTGYMLSVLASRSEPRDDELDDLLSEGRARREREDRWRLLVLEDAGEFLGMAAPAEVGRGFARLLNIADGLLGQGTKALILVTTNEPLGKLHPAALRPGRAMAALEFAPLRADEATAWLSERGLERRVDSPKTLAELHAILTGGQPGGPVAETARPPTVGFS
jgi:ATPase family associated with various cellular activities (AAA)